MKANFKLHLFRPFVATLNLFQKIDTYFRTKSCFTDLEETRPCLKFLIRWWDFENIPSRKFWSCPSQSDLFNIFSCEQKKWTLINYFLHPTLLEPKQWILELKTQFSCCSILYLSAFIFNFICELSSCANQTFFLQSFQFRGLQTVIKPNNRTVWNDWTFVLRQKVLKSCFCQVCRI